MDALGGARMRHEPAEIDEMTASRMERQLRTGARPNLTIGYERAWDVLTSVGPCTAPLHSRVLRVSSTTYFSLPNYALRENHTDRTRVHRVPWFSV